MGTLRVVLADAPTDVLVRLVDHGPAAATVVAREVARPDAADPVGTVVRALRLLEQMGWARFDPERHEGAVRFVWSATDAGRAAIAAARAEVAS